MNSRLEDLKREVDRADTDAKNARIAYNEAVNADRKRQIAVLQELYRDGTLTEDFLENELYVMTETIDEITGRKKQIAEQSEQRGDGLSFADRIEAENENAGPHE